MKTSWDSWTGTSALKYQSASFPAFSLLHFRSFLQLDQCEWSNPLRFCSWFTCLCGQRSSRNAPQIKLFPLPVFPPWLHVPSCLAHPVGPVLVASSLPFQGAPSYRAGRLLAQLSGPPLYTTTDNNEYDDDLRLTGWQVFLLNWCKLKGEVWNMGKCSLSCSFFFILFIWATPPSLHSKYHLHPANASAGLA